MSKTSKIVVRCDAAFKERVANSAGLHGMSEAALMRHCYLRWAKEIGEVEESAKAFKEKFGVKEPKP